MSNFVGNFLLTGRSVGFNVFAEELKNLELKGCRKYCVEVCVFKKCYDLPNCLSDFDFNQAVLINCGLFMFPNSQGTYGYENTIELMFDTFFGTVHYTDQEYFLGSGGEIFYNIYVIRFFEV